MKRERRLELRAKLEGGEHAAILIDIHNIEVERDSLRAKVEDFQNATKFAVEEGCGDEVHCACVPQLRVEVERLRLALAAIADHPHNRYKSNESGQYGIGVTDGHRCAAAMALLALRPS